MFNALTKGEPPTGAEPLRSGLRLPRSGWPLTLLATSRGRGGNGPARKRPAWRGRAIAIAAMTAVIGGTLLLGTLVRPVPRTCLMLASAGSSATAAAAARATSYQPVGGVAGARAPACPAYPAKK
jgi:hypothetical protein